MGEPRIKAVTNKGDQQVGTSRLEKGLYLVQKCHLELILKWVWRESVKNRTLMSKYHEKHTIGNNLNWEYCVKKNQRKSFLDSAAFNLHPCFYFIFWEKQFMKMLKKADQFLFFFQFFKLKIDKLRNVWIEKRGSRPFSYFTRIISDSRHQLKIWHF